MKIRRGDSVVITTGEDAAQAPRRVTQVLDGGRKVVVEGANRVLKHVRRGHPKSPQGGRLNLEMPIDSSNVMLYCGACSRGVRVGYRYSDDGAKERFCRSCSQTLGAVSPAKERRAAKS
jgi:large subunit ribosomal protein L24